MRTNQNMGNSPVAFIAKNKQRVKQYNSIVYLKNGDEFQIELFNPTQTKVLAKIEMDGKSIGNGIILRPGERVFLERYVNDPKKFKFETYEVEDHNREVANAIQNNGSISVNFYKEQAIELYSGNITTSRYTYNSPYTYTSPNIFTNTPLRSNPEIYYTNGLPNIEVSGTISSTCCPTASHASMSVFDSSPNTNINDVKGRSLSKSTIETGRVEKGSYSDQTFAADYTKFESVSEWTSKWSILPESRKQITSEDLVAYCASCGRRRRANENYCPSCGRKF